MEYSRRSFFFVVQSGLAAVGLAGWPTTVRAAAAIGEPGNEGVDYYDKLGVEKIINAAGTYTDLTAAVMPLPVQLAVAKAARRPVRLEPLQKAAGAYLAGKLQCEAALVSAGAASALFLGTAACITVANQKQGEDIPGRLPQALGNLKNEVIMQKAHRYSYDHALPAVGARIVEVESLDDYRAAFTPNTVMTHFYNAAPGGSISREDWIRIAHEHGVPCMNDAAADMPPISNLWNYTKMGFDLVIFSGGKGIRGPQNAGLLLGKAKLVAAAAQNNNPNDNVVGRGQKVAKEQIVGMVAAIDWLLSQSDEEMEAGYRKRALGIAERLRNVPSLRAQIYIPEVANHVPTLLLRYDQTKVKISPRQVAEVLRKGTPSIELHPATGSPEPGIPSDENTIVVGVWMLQEGEDVVVAQRLDEVLMGAVRS